MDGRRRKTVHAARRPEERPKDASHSSTFTECTAAMLTLPSFAGPTSARSVTRTVRMRFSVGTPRDISGKEGTGGSAGEVAGEHTAAADAGRVDHCALGIKVGRPDHHAYGGRKDNDATHICSEDRCGSGFVDRRGSPAAVVLRVPWSG